MGLIRQCWDTQSWVFALSYSGTGLETQAISAVFSHSHKETHGRTQILLAYFIHILNRLTLQAYCMELRSTTIDKDTAVSHSCKPALCVEVYSGLIKLNATHLCHVETIQKCERSGWTALIHPVWQSAIEWFIVTNHKPFNDQMQPLNNHSHPSIQLLWLSDVLLHCALRSVTPASGAEDFKRSTCLSIFSALLSKPSPFSGSREKEKVICRRRGNLEPLSPLVSSLSLTLPMGQACRTLLVLLVSPASCPLQLAGPPHGPSCTLHSYIDFLEGQESVAGWWERTSKGGGIEKSRELSKALTSPWLHLETRQPC